MARRRDGIPKGLRFRVLARDGNRCVYCGRGVTDGAVLVLDHRFPHRMGGPDEAWNLVASCQECNSGKGDAVLIPPGTTCADSSDDGELCGEPATHVVGNLGLVDSFGVWVYPACARHAAAWVDGMRAEAIPFDG